MEKSAGLIKSSISARPTSGNKKGSKMTAKNDSNNYIPEKIPTVAAPRQKVIINQVSGQANPSQVLAIMGPSGSGEYIS